MHKLLIPATAATLLLTTAACDPASLGVAAAGVVLNALTEQPGQIAEQVPNIMQSLSGLDDSVSDSCLAKLDDRAGADAPAKDIDVTTRVSNSGVPLAVASEADETPTSTDVDVAQTSTEPVQTITMSTQTDRVCRIQPVCLPGNSYPVEMMMCSDAEVTTVQTDIGVDAELVADQQPKTVNWAWNEGEEVDVVSSP